jgi:hypothetical protein
MIEIQPISLGLPPQQGVKIWIRPLIGSTTDVTCELYYEVLSVENKNLACGNITVDEETYAAWGADNTFIENIVLQSLGLTRI